MRILGIDYGRARIGLAISDEEGIVVQPLPALRWSSEALALKEIARHVETQGVGRIVVGVPYNMDGTLGEMAQEATAFARSVERAVGRPVDTHDERGSSLEADRVLREGKAPRKRRKELQDSLAAAVILRDYLDARRGDREIA
jgi:putative Holliday junction resolvase